MDVLVKIFVEFYAAFVDLSEVSFFLEASQNGCLCHFYCTRSQYLDYSSEGVRLPNYIPTLRVNPGGRNDIIESYFRLEVNKNVAKKLDKNFDMRAEKVTEITALFLVFM